MLLLVAAATAGAAETGECAAGSNSNDDGTCRPPAAPEQCGVYMAPSTLGGDTNMGIYAGIDYGPGQDINFPEIAIPLLFRMWGFHGDLTTDGTLWDRYIWDGNVANLESYRDDNVMDARAVFVPGVGCTINGVMNMNNIISTHDSVYEMSGLHRSKDPGSGASTPYHASKSVAIVPIDAGAEIFADYGQDWVPDIPGAQITITNFMQEADEFVESEFAPFLEQHSKALSDDLKEGLWDLTTSFPFYSKAFTNLPKSNSWKEVEQMLTKLQEEKESKPKFGFNINNKFQEAQFGYGYDRSPTNDLLTGRFHRKNTVRSLDWLQTHPNSYCQDHIKPQRSTIEQAGMGAFASRPLKKGQVIGYAPLIHIGKHGRAVFNVKLAPKTNPEDFNSDDPDAPSHPDLVLNYSFGHRNSSLLLTPYGAMVNYINHNFDKDKINVQVRWPDKELIAHKPEWLGEDIEFLRNTIQKIGLSFEY